MEKKAVISSKDGHYYIKKSEVPIEMVNKFRDELANIKPLTSSKYMTKVFSLWQEYDKYVRLPRMLGLKSFPDVVPKIALSSPEKGNWGLTVNGLRSYQVDAVNRVVADYSGGGLGGIIKFGCGRGKTRTAIAACCKIDKPTLVIVNLDNVCDVWINEIKGLFPDLIVPVLSRLKVKVAKHVPFTICCYKTVVNMEPEFFQAYEVVILDEVHEYLTEISLGIFSRVSRRYLLGLSATPSKHNGLHYLLDYYVGPIISDCPAEYDGKLPVVKMINFHPDGTDGLKTYQEVHEKVQKDPIREQLVMSQVRKWLTGENKILVIGSYREQLERYHGDLEETHPGQSLVYYSCTSQKKEREEQLQKVRVIFAIKQLGYQSINVPDLNVLILSAKYIPKNDGENTEKIEQLCGRILRKKHTTSPIIVDIVDNHFYYNKHTRLCVEFYENQGFLFI